MENHNLPRNDREACVRIFEAAIGDLPTSLPYGDLDNPIHPLFRREVFRVRAATVTIISEAA